MADSHRVLIVEDEKRMLLALRDNLEFEGYEVITATDGEAGLAAAIKRRPDVVILDIMLPRLSGFDVCRAIRERGMRMPILLLSARSQESDKVLGLGLGADDYVTKPFSINELLARVRALLRRAKALANLDGTCSFGDVEIDFLHQTAKKAGVSMSLSNLEFEAIRYLIEHRGEAVSREDLLDQVWGYKEFSTTRAVDNLVVRLRKKLEDDPTAPQHILTVHGVGYKFVD